LMQNQQKKPEIVYTDCHDIFYYELVSLWAQLTKIYPLLPTFVQPISITKTLLIVPTKNGPLISANFCHIVVNRCVSTLIERLIIRDDHYKSTVEMFIQPFDLYLIFILHLLPCWCGYPKRKKKKKKEKKYSKIIKVCETVSSTN
jgi:hypothetical protein